MASFFFVWGGGSQTTTPGSETWLKTLGFFKGTAVFIVRSPVGSLGS